MIIGLRTVPGVKAYARAVAISDNNGFDWQFMNWYFHHFLGRNRNR